MLGPVRKTSLVIWLILLLCCLDLIKGKTKIPSVFDCRNDQEKKLNCTNHGFQNVPYDYYKGWGYYNIYLSENPYICDCSIVWFLREPADVRKNVKDLDEMRCAYPDKLNMKKIAELKEEEICDAERVSFKKFCDPPAGKSRYWNCDNRGLDYIPYDIFVRKHGFSLIGQYLCDCNMVWFVRYLLRYFRKRLIPNFDRITCKAPDSFLNVAVVKLNENDICPQKDLIKGKAKIPSVFDCRNDQKKKLNCTNHGFQNVPYDYYKGWGYYNIYLSENPYICDCSIVWFLREPADVRKNVKDLDEMRCAYPDKLNMKKIAELKEEEICDAERVSFKKFCDPPAGKSRYWNCDNRGLDYIPYDIFVRKHGFSLIGQYLCDCNMVWFVRYLLRYFRKRLIPNFDRITCKAPDSFLNVAVVKLSENDICPQKEPDLCKARPCPKTSTCELAGKMAYICVDIDECATEQDECHEDAKCINTKPGYKCQCKPGFTEYDNGRQCKDVNECTGKSPCSQNAKCMNIPGSYKCVCLTGFVGDGKECKDIDECKTKKDCSIYAECKNTPGPDKCVCKKGYHGNGKICRDIDECDGKVCPAQANCQNTLGSYSCECFPGYQLKHGQCLDVDECKTNTHTCDKNALCMNQWGGYKCRCNDGYEEHNSGRICSKKDEASRSNSLLVIVIVVPMCLLVIVLAGLGLYFHRKNRKKQNEQNKNNADALLKNEHVTQHVFKFNPHANRKANSPEDMATLFESSDEEIDYDDY